MMIINVQRTHPNARLPDYASAGAACFDLYAATVNGCATIGDVVYPGHPALVDTGLAFEVPPGFVLRIASRSGLAFQHGIEAFPGVIDSDYRGSVKVLLRCLHAEDETPPPKINPGDRVAQAYIVELPRVRFAECAALSETERGTSGFGSTGK